MSVSVSVYVDGMAAVENCAVHLNFLRSIFAKKKLDLTKKDMEINMKYLTRSYEDLKAAYEAMPG